MHGVDGATVGVLAVGQRTHRVQSRFDRVEGHADSHGGADTDSSANPAVHGDGTEEIIHILLHPVVGTRTGGSHTSQLKAVGESATEQGTLLSDLDEAVEDILVVSSALLGVQLISLHTGEDDLEGVGEHTAHDTTSSASVHVEVPSSLTSGIRVDPVVEVEETPDAGRGVGEGTQSERIVAREELLDAATSRMDVVEHVDGVETASEADAGEALALLKHLGACLHKINRLRLQKKHNSQRLNVQRDQYTYQGMRDESNGVSSDEALTVHSLVLVAPVLN